MADPQLATHRPDRNADRRRREGKKPARSAARSFHQHQRRTLGGARRQESSQRMDRPRHAPTFPRSQSRQSNLIAGWEDEAGEVRRRLNRIEAAERKADATEPLAERLADRFTYIDAARFGPVWGRPAQHATPTSDTDRPVATPTVRTGQRQPTDSGPADQRLRRRRERQRGRRAVHGRLGRMGARHQMRGAYPAPPPQGRQHHNDHAYRGASAWSAEARFHWQLTGQKVARKWTNRTTC